DAARGQRADGAGGDGVDADVFRAEIPCQVADGGFQRRLGQRHHVVIGDDLFRGVIRQRHDAAAIGHERGGGAADGDQRIDADLVGDAKAFAAGVDERSSEIFGGCVSYGVYQNVELAVSFLEGGKKRLDFLVIGEVAMETGG